jgi:acyl transferase domain-containing protein/NAD(P)H-dependent flavin oxidoreductase YrpB (nitropropane dioxygenase family)/NAD(P)-dependent dehydrogenase (short-subunit alcohol dehydrogenase family)
MQTLDVIVLTPAASAEPSLAIAACRAGSLGIVDLEYAPDLARATEAVARLRRHTSTPFGVKFGVGGEKLLSHLLEAPDRLATILVAGGEHAEVGGWFRLLRTHRMRILWEATTLSEAGIGVALGADGLVLKGNEAGGRVGADTAFILLQRWMARSAEQGKPRLPVWVQGGIGLNTAAGCMAAGAAGIVLDAQLFLARESSLSEPARARLAVCDGTQTICVGERLGQTYRFYGRPGLLATEELRREEERLAAAPIASRQQSWQDEVRMRVAADPERGLWLIGQDAAFARPLAESYGTVAGILQAIRERVHSHLAWVRSRKVLTEGAPLAQSHKTRYPIVQGPMTRVSDNAAFAEAVAEAGALPFLALALLRRHEAEDLLRQTQTRLGGRPWGAGILGFAPPEVRREQTQAIRAVCPPFALIAGGRPDQARELEKAGIPTYLHVPSPGLLRMFLRDGARRFVFEGRECGGHVGPRSSFVLWEAICEALQEHLGSTRSGDGLHVLFAGGIHDARSAVIVSALAAGLAQRGVAVGVLIGTAYLFTAEAVAAGAIVPRYQQEAITCRDTILLETGPGHAIRCIPTPYAEAFEALKRCLHEEGRGADKVREAMEALNVGRLRIASKGLERTSERTCELVEVSQEEQYRRGMYMIGQAAALRDRVVSMTELHKDICTGSARLLEALPPSEIRVAARREQPADVAIIGMACFLPGASDLRTYWENVLAKVNAVTEVPADHWDWRLYYDPDPKARDKINSKWGGFLADMPFDPLAFGMPPNSLSSIEPVQLYVLEAVRLALADAGYAERPFDRERTAVVLGAGGGAAQLAIAYSFRSYLPMLATVPCLGDQVAEVLRKAGPLLPEWTEDSFPGILVNVIAGRVANRFNFGGPNFAVDAACGSSLAALYAAIRELESGTSDLAVVVGADTVQNPYTYMAFSKTHAFSPRGRCSTFDEAADGIVISEGVAVVLIKRLADDERDGDRIYAIVKGVGASSDGRDKGLTAPRPEGQLRALRRAYDKAGVSPARVGLVEAHGTGTAVGDQTEVQALCQVFHEAGAAPQSCVVGSVKSVIGHTKCAAGLAGLVNAVLSLHHKVLPPLLVERPNPKASFEESPFVLNTQARPWVHGSDYPRCAGVSAFGFGGTNFHAVLEEYTGGFLPQADAPLSRWPAELFVWRRPTVEELEGGLRQCLAALDRGAQPPLSALALTLWKNCLPEPTLPTLAVVASSTEDLRDKLKRAQELLANARQAQDPPGVFFSPRPGFPRGESGAKVAFLFPGQGSQYPDMLAQLALAFSEVRAAFDEAERVLVGDLERPLGKFIFPPSPFTPQQEQANRQAVARTDVAQPALGAAEVGLCRLLARLGIEPDLLAGHSYGEYVALWAAGVLETDSLIRLSYLRGKVLRETAADMPGAMAALEAGPEQTRKLLDGLPQVAVANFNAPRQTVISGSEQGVSAALARAGMEGIAGQRLAVACGFHSPLVEKTQEPFARILATFHFRGPQRQVFANTTAAPYPDDPAAFAGLLARHLASPVRFQEEVEALYAAGARVFVEVGPQAALTGLVGQTLSGRPHLALAADSRSRPSLVQLQYLLAQLLVAGVPVKLDRLYEGRVCAPLDLVHRDEAGKDKQPASAWLVNSVRARPLHGPEPRLLGQTANEHPVPAAGAQQSESGALRAPGTNGFHAVPLPPSAASNEEADKVVLRFQDLMASFLETQRSVMLGYIQGSQAAGAASPKPVEHPAIKPSVPARNGAHANGNHAPPPIPPDTTATPIAAQQSHPCPAADQRDSLTKHLMTIVCQRTGYPPETLGLDLDLEADLGIDSIKRVEILGMLAEAQNNTGSGVHVELESLTGIKTLRGLIEALLAGKHGGNGHSAHQGAMADQKSAASVPEHISVQRRLVAAVELPGVKGTPALPRSGAVFLTDDGRGVAISLAKLFLARGLTPVLLRTPRTVASNGAGLTFATDLADAEQINEILAEVRQRGEAVVGLVHLLPLAGAGPGESSQERLNREVKSLFLLARGLSDDLGRAASGPAFLLSATAMGGAFGEVVAGAALPASLFPGQGGVVGLVKTLAHEWPEVLVRAVDFEPAVPAATAADCLLAELADPHGPVEIGYRDGQRRTLECRLASLDTTGAALLELGPDDVLLLSGGARGITAAVALELARLYRPTLVLVGRSSLPEEPERADTAGLSTSADLKAALLARSRREGRQATPALLDQAYQCLVHEREVRSNLERLRATGARVHYHATDVRDEMAFTKLIAEVYHCFGRLDGVIHGAGVIHDKLIRDKTPASFDRVFGTKVDSANILARHLRLEELKFLVFFASVAGRFGNRGQSDYAAANEVLSKLARELDRRMSGRVVSVAWGPWSGVGMVSDLERHLGQRGLQMIPADVGPRLLIDELRFGRKGDCEVVIAGDVGQLSRSAPRGANCETSQQ